MPSPVRDGHVTQEYGVPGDYAAGYHTGRDWAGGSGDIVATRAGKVTRVSYDGDYGNRVEILTGDIEHSYSHMASIAVVTGQDVAQGAYLGEMGSTGNSTGPHCHYEERYSPFGYYDSREPEFDKTASEEMEDLVMAYPITLFNYAGSIYQANLLSGTYQRILNEQDYNDRLAILAQGGIPVRWHNNDAGAQVGNPEAFGVLIG